MVNAELSANLRDVINRCRELQQHSQKCRKRAEELTVQAERLFTERKLIEERGTVRIANNLGKNDNGKPTRRKQSDLKDTISVKPLTNTIGFATARQAYGETSNSR